MLSHPAAGWSIRRLADRDRETCLDIFMACLGDFHWRGPHGRYTAPLMAALSRRTSWVAEEPRAGIVGFITLKPRLAYVDHLFVDVDWRLCGIGRGLLTVAREAAAKPLTLTVDVQNTAARRAYEALGWMPTGQAGGDGNSGWMRLVSP